MANVQKIEGVKGISYKLTAYCGYDSKGKQIRKSKTWKPSKGMTVRQAEKQAFVEAELFEEAVNKGITAFDGRIRFTEYADIWFANAQIAPKTRERYVVLLRRINAAIGHLRLENIQAHHLEAFYNNLKEDNIKETGRYAIPCGLCALMSDKELTRAAVARLSGVSSRTVSIARKGGRISLDSAEKIAVALEVPVKQIFTIYQNTSGLSDQTILHHHRLLAAILGKAKLERIIPFNPASEHMNAPKVRRKESRYLSDTQAQHIVELLLQETDIRKKAAILLCLYSGIRRGEFGGLQWKDIDWQNSLIHILRAIQWQQGKGVVEVDTKNESSKRVIRLPQLIFDLLAEYRTYWLEQRLKCGSTWEGDDWIFIQENGRPLAPNTLNFWLNKFIEKHGLPHFSPHSLRHTFCSLQIASGVNIRTVQARSGHSRASTLTDIYSHALKTADERASDTLDDILTPKDRKIAVISRQQA